MTDVVRRVATSMSLDGAQYTQQAAAVAQSNEKLVQTGERVAATEEKVSARTVTGATALERLQRQVDKAYASEQARARQLGILDRALADGNLTVARHAQLLEKVERAYAQTQGRLNQTEPAVERVGRAFSRINGYLGAFGVGISLYGLVNLGRQTLQFGDDLEAAADQFGIAVEKIQAFQYAAREGDIAPQQAQQALQRFTQTLGDAANGADEAEGRFEALGVKIKDGAGRTRDAASVLEDVARRISMIEDPAERASAAVDFFGKSGARLGPMLREIGGGFETLTERASEAGEVMSEETVKALAAANREIESLGVQITIAAGNALMWIRKLQETSDQVELGTPTAQVTSRETLDRRLAEIDRQLAPYGVGTGADTDPGASSMQLAAINALLQERLNILRQIQAVDRGIADQGREQLSGAIRDEVRSGPGVKYTPPASGGGGGMSPAEKFAAELERLERQLDPAGAALQDYEKNLGTLERAYAERLIPTEERYLELRTRLQQKFDESTSGPQKAIDKAERMLASLEAETQALLAGEVAYDAFNRARAQTDALASFEEQIRRETAGLEDQEAVVGQLVTRYGFLLEAKDDAVRAAEELAEAEATTGEIAGEAVGAVRDLFGMIENDSFTAEAALKRVADAMLRIAELAIFGQEGIEGFFVDMLSGALGSVSSVGGAPQGGLSGGPRGYARGGAFGGGGEIQAFAGGGVVRQATLFKFAAGGVRRTGVMGEAGEEGILPLKRTASGALGVQVAGGAGGSGGGIVIGAINVTVEGNGQETPEQQGQRTGRAIRDELRGLVREEMANQQRNGGMLKPGYFS